MTALHADDFWDEIFLASRAERDSYRERKWTIADHRCAYVPFTYKGYRAAIVQTRTALGYATMILLYLKRKPVAARLIGMELKWLRAPDKVESGILKLIMDYPFANAA